MSLLDLNSLRTSTGVLREPRCTVTVNGAILSGVLEVEVTNASHFTADTFRVICASSGLVAALNPAYWALSVCDQVAVSETLGTGTTQLRQMAGLFE